MLIVKSIARIWVKFLQLEKRDKTRQNNFITFAHNTLMADLAPQVAKASRGGPGTI